jgi:hypothetical protein
MSEDICILIIKNATATLHFVPVFDRLTSMVPVFNTGMVCKDFWYILRHLQFSTCTGTFQFLFV